jgi:hypothetical protein
VIIGVPEYLAPVISRGITMKELFIDTITNVGYFTVCSKRTAIVGVKTCVFSKQLQS